MTGRGVRGVARPGPQLVVEAAGQLVQARRPVGAVRPTGSRTSRPAPGAPRPAAAARRRRARRARRWAAARRRARWLPLHATCSPHTSPDRKPNPLVPATSSSDASWPPWPRRLSRSRVPTWNGCRCGRALAQVPAGEVEQLVGHRWHRQGDVHRVHPVGLGGMRVGQAGSDADQTRGRQLDLDDDVEGRVRVGPPDDERPAEPAARSTSVTVNSGDQPRPSRWPVTPGQPAYPSACSGRIAAGTGLVDDVGRHLGDRDDGELAQRVVGQLAEIGAPVKDSR